MADFSFPTGLPPQQKAPVQYKNFFGQQLDPTQGIFYNDPNNRQVGWQMLQNYLGARGNNTFDNFLQRQMGQQYNNYLSQTAGQKGALDWTDYLTQNASKIADMWKNLPSAQKGANPAAYGGNQVYLG
jgi:hypothetical protein